MEIESLRKISFLRELTDDELNSFAALLDTREYQQGELILEEGTAPSAFQVIREGNVHVRRRANTRDMLLARLGPGAFFGEINLFDPGVATASIHAMKKTLIAAIPYARFHAFMDENPRAGYRIVRSLLTELSRRMRTTDERLANAVLRPVGPEGEASS